MQQISMRMYGIPMDTNLQKIHKTSFKYNKFYTNKLKLQPVLH